MVIEVRLQAEKVFVAVQNVLNIYRVTLYQDQVTRLQRECEARGMFRIRTVIVIIPYHFAARM